MTDVCVPVVHNIVVLDADGYRVLAKYFDGRAAADQSRLESALFKRSKSVSAKTEGEWLRALRGVRRSLTRCIVP